MSDDRPEGPTPITPETMELPVIDRLATARANVPWVFAQEALPYWNTYEEFAAHLGSCPACDYAQRTGGPLCGEGDALEYAARWDMDAQKAAAAWN